MSSEDKKVIIKVDDIYKSFKVFHDKGATLKEKLLFANRRRYELRNVLNGISFKVFKGEVVGLIGENGCGKSTLLKLLTKIMYPNNGTIEIEGRVSSLLELGAGFHPDLTGRENIYTNASIFGLTRSEIDSRIDDIIEFSELEEFIDNPVRTYSSGMYMRLAFSVAINVDAEVLLIDEILAVGDANFQAKCFRKIQEIKNQGITIVFVSHDLGTVQKLCDRAIYIYKGEIKSEGKPYNVVNSYLEDVMQKDENLPEGDHEGIQENNQDNHKENSENYQHINNDISKKFMSRHGNRAVEIITIKMAEDDNGIEKSTFKTGNSIKIEVEYRRNNPNIKTVVFGIGIFRNDGIRCYGTNTQNDNIEVKLNDTGKLEVCLEEFEILPGDYWIDVALHDEFATIYDFISGAIRFNVFCNLSDVGIARLKHTFKV